jgi:hypothetical protein
LSQLSQVNFRSAFTNLRNITTIYLQNIENKWFINVIKNVKPGGFVHSLAHLNFPAWISARLIYLYFNMIRFN